MNRSPRLTGIKSTLVAGLLFASMAGAATREETIDETRPFSPGSLLEVDNTNGSIEVSTWEGDGVRIVAEKKVRTRGMEDIDAAFRDLEVIIEQTAGGIRIDTHYPRRNGGWWGEASFSVDYRIQVPQQADLALETVNGKVSVEGVRGDLSLESTNGGITVDDAGGRVDAHTTNGGIDVELQNVVEGEGMTFRSTNGGITLALPSGARASVEASTTNGGIHTDFPITVQGSFSKKRMEGEINGGGGLIELRTTNGGIRIREI